jgi:hypothetical protein
MAAPLDGSGRYDVDVSEVVLEQLKRLQRQATRRGQGMAFASAFRHILRALQRDPNVAGEPLYPLPNLGLQMRTMAVAPLVIDFAVSDKDRVVYIKSGRLLSGPPS